MKKNIYTVLTAAMFAASGMSAIPASAGEVSGHTDSSAADLNEHSTLVEATTTVTQTVYGPPVYLLGDMNEDFRVDSFDAIALRRAILNDNVPSFAARFNGDINQDGNINVADLILLNRFLLGTIKNFNDFSVLPDDKNNSENDNTDNSGNDDDVYNPENDEIAGVYGPPWWFDDKEPDDSGAEVDYIPEEDVVAPVYGPPWWFDDTESEQSLPEQTDTANEEN